MDPTQKWNPQEIVEVVMHIAKNHIPKNYSKEYIPRWNMECKSINKDYQKWRD